MKKSVFLFTVGLLLTQSLYAGNQDLGKQTGIFVAGVAATMVLERLFSAHIDALFTNSRAIAYRAASMVANGFILSSSHRFYERERGLKTAVPIGIMCVSGITLADNLLQLFDNRILADIKPWNRLARMLDP